MLRMREHRLPSRRVWLLVIIAVVLIAGHGFFLYYFRAHLVLSAAVVWVVIKAVGMQDLGLVGELYASVLRRFWRAHLQPESTVQSCLTSASIYPCERSSN